MQELRHFADYNNAAGFTAHEANIYINRTDATILNFLQVPRCEQAYIATLTLIRPRQAELPAEQTSALRRVP